MESRSKNALFVREAKETLARAEKVTLTDFSAALTSGVLSAIEARRPPDGAAGLNWRKWIWAGFIIGDGVPPIGDGPPGPGGPGSPE